MVHSGNPCYNELQSEAINMVQLKRDRPCTTFRGTWDQILARTAEIPKSSEVELRVYGPEPVNVTATMALMQQWLEEDATDDPQEIREAEGELRSFKSKMNSPRKESGARLLYPEVE